MSQTNGTQMTNKLEDKSVRIDEDESAKKSVSAVDYGVEDVPPWPTAIFLGLQVPYFLFSDIHFLQNICCHTTTLPRSKSTVILFAAMRLCCHAATT